MRSLGHLHCDIGFMSVVREYETPKTFRHGFFVAKDVVSRFAYVEMLGGPRSADNLIKVLKRLLKKHREKKDYLIKSISFDKEPAVVGHKVQEYLARKNISFHAFEFSDSKAKVAENLIRLIRTDLSRLMRNNPKRRWWKILSELVDNLNKKPIMVQGKTTGFTPASINSSNVKLYLEKVFKLSPSLEFSQFNVLVPTIHFAFQANDLVRVKTITVSSQILGLKRSQVNLETTLFKVKHQVAYLSQKHVVVPGYICEDLETKQEHFFSEEDLVLSIVDTYQNGG
jgi:hypothetical protein